MTSVQRGLPARHATPCGSGKGLFRECLERRDHFAVDHLAPLEHHRPCAQLFLLETRGIKVLDVFRDGRGRPFRHGTQLERRLLAPGVDMAQVVFRRPVFGRANRLAFFVAKSGDQRLAITLCTGYDLSQLGLQLLVCAAFHRHFSSNVGMLGLALCGA